MDEKKEWLRKLQEETEIPEIVRQRAEQTFEQIKREDQQKDTNKNSRYKGAVRKGRGRSKRRIAIAAAAATLLVSTLTVGAAAYFQWNSKFSEKYHVTPEMEKKLNDSNTAKEVNAYTEHDGLKIEAVQTVADGNIAHILLKIWGSEEFPFNSHMNFGDLSFQVEGNDKVGMFGGFIDSLTEEEWANGAEYEILLQDTGDTGLLNREITLTFQNVVDSYEGKVNMTEPPVLLDSVWELKLTLDNEDSGTEFQIDQQIPGSEAFVRDVHLSSISYTVDMDWDYQTEILPAFDPETGENGTFEHVVNPPELTGVVYEDGTVMENTASVLGGHFTNEEKTEYRSNGYTSEMLEYEKVSELIFLTNEGQVRIPVKNK